MRIAQHISEIIGNTPLVQLNSVVAAGSCRVVAKVEYLNPGLSSKDRIAVKMIDAAEASGQLKPGGTIVEPTSGNTGVGLALVAQYRGYRCVFICPDKVSEDKQNVLRAYGAEVVVCPTSVPPEHPDSYYSVARRLARETKNGWQPDQYANPDNPAAHFHWTGPEIWRQTEGKITHFVAGIGTGGTISGTGRFLKEKNPAIQIIGADPYGSIFKTFKETGKLVETTPYLVEGIGQEIVPPNVHIKYVDEVVNVTDSESFEMSRLLGRMEGIFCGGSTGTNLAAALRVSKDLDENAIVVFIVCDTGEHYLSKHHSDEWLKEKRLLEPQRITAGLISGTKKPQAPKTLIYVQPTDNVGQALEKMDELGLTQIPVLEEGRAVGSLRENRVLAKVVRDRELLSSPVSDVMESSFPTVDVDASSS